MFSSRQLQAYPSTDPQQRHVCPASCLPLSDPGWRASVRLSVCLSQCKTAASKAKRPLQMSLWHADWDVNRCCNDRIVHRCSFLGGRCIAAVEFLRTQLSKRVRRACRVVRRLACSQRDVRGLRAVGPQRTARCTQRLFWGREAKLQEPWWWLCKPANTNNTQPLLWSVKWPDMFGEWDTGVWTGVLVCVFRVWPEVCVCFLSVMAPDPLLQIKQSPLALNGPGGQCFPSLSRFLPSNVGPGCGWTGHDSVHEIQHNVRVSAHHHHPHHLFPLSLWCLKSGPAKAAVWSCPDFSLGVICASVWQVKGKWRGQQLNSQRCPKPPWPPPLPLSSRTQASVFVVM